LEGVKLEKAEGKSYVIFKLINQSDEKNVALELKDNGGYYTFSGISHECKGDPCSSCGFVYINGEITGCKCNDPDPYRKNCNHTIKYIPEPTEVGE
jgi:hypothetical protein